MVSMPRKSKTVRQAPPRGRARQSEAARSVSIAALDVSADGVSLSLLPFYDSVSLKPLSAKSMSLAPLMMSAEMINAPFRKSAEIVVHKLAMEDIGDAPALPNLTKASDFKGRILANEDQYTKEAVWDALRNKEYRTWRTNQEKIQRMPEGPARTLLERKVRGDGDSMNNIPGMEYRTYMAKMENDRLHSEYEDRLEQHNAKAAKNNELILAHHVRKDAAREQKERRSRAAKEFEMRKIDQQQRHANLRRDWDEKKLAQDRRHIDRPRMEVEWKELNDAHIQRKADHDREVVEREGKEAARKERNAEKARLRGEHAARVTEQSKRRKDQQIAKERAEEADRLSKIQAQLEKGKAKRTSYLQHKVGDTLRTNIKTYREKVMAANQEKDRLARMESQKQADALRRTLRERPHQRLRAHTKLGCRFDKSAVGLWPLQPSTHLHHARWCIGAVFKMVCRR